MNTKTAMMKLIEKLNKLSPNSGDTDVSKAFNEGVQWAIQYAKGHLGEEKEQIINAYVDAKTYRAYDTEYGILAEDYYNQTYNQKP